MSKKQQETEVLEVTDYMDRIGDWVEKNSKLFISAFMVLVLGVGVYFSVSYVKSRKLNSIAKKAGVINRRVDLLEKAMTEVKDKSSDQFKANLKKEISSIDVLVKNLIKDHPDQNITDLASLKWAGFLIDEKKEDQALEVLSSLSINPTRDLSAAALLLKAKLLVDKSQGQEAASIYEMIASKDSWSVFHAEALIQRALLFEKNGKREEAMKLLAEAKNKNRESSFSEDANKYMRLLKIKTSKPDLFQDSEG